MQKTKLGISVGLIGAIIYFAGLFSGILAMVVIAGYVLLAEENEWLKKSAVKAITLSVTFSVLITVLGLIPDVIGIVDSFLNIFNINFYIPMINSIISLLKSIVNFVETLVFLGLGLKALNQGTIEIPVVDDLIKKYMD